MSDARDQREEMNAAASESWLARLVLLIASLFEVFANTTPRQYREAAEARSDWRDHWANLRRCEWHLSQILAREAMELITGRPIPFELIVEPPENYGGPCPKSPAELARRFAFTARWMHDLDTLVLRHTRRIARRMGLTYRGVPLVAHGSTDAALRATAHHEAVSVAAARLPEAREALMVSRPQRGRPSNHEGGLANARAPPIIPRLPITDCLLPHERQLLGSPPRT